MVNFNYNQLTSQNFNMTHNWLMIDKLIFTLNLVTRKLNSHVIHLNPKSIIWKTSNLRDKESFTVISLASHTSSNGPSLKAMNQIWTKTICKTSQILLLNILKLIRIVTKNGLITKGWDMPWFAQKTWIQRSQRTLMLLVEAFKISDFNNNYFIIIIKKQNKIYNHF